MTSIKLCNFFFLFLALLSIIPDQVSCGKGDGHKIIVSAGGRGKKEKCNCHEKIVPVPVPVPVHHE